MSIANVEVRLEEGMSQDKLLKKFLKKCKNENIIREYLDRVSFHMTKSQKEKAKRRKNQFLRQQKHQ